MKRNMLKLLVFYVLLIDPSLSQEIITPFVFSDCKHLILPSRCQCYHSGHESQLRCLHSELHSLPKLPNNMRWNALDFSYNYITSIDNYVFADIYVEKIILKWNYLRRIEITSFHQIQNLKELRLDHNQLKELDAQVFKSPGESLEIFDVSFNPFQFLDVGGILLHLPLLKELHLVSCNLSDSSFYTMRKLNEFNNVDENENNFKRVFHHLEIIDFSFNNITTLCSNIFESFYNLLELRLHHNSIYLIDNNILQPFVRLRSLDLSKNLIEFVPKLSSRSLEKLNFSSNLIHHLSDYFSAHLHNIKSMDFDHNGHLNGTTMRAFCFLNVESLEKLTFRNNNLISLNTFAELLCRLTNSTEKKQLIDINNNVNLKCNCTLIEFQNIFNNYQELTCTQQGQDRYYISNLAHWFSDCSFDFCSRKSFVLVNDFCNWNDAERLLHQGTCQVKQRAIDERKRIRTKTVLTTTMMTTTNSYQTTLSRDDFVFSTENLTDIFNSTIELNSTSVSIEKVSRSNQFVNKINRWFLFVTFFFNSLLISIEH